MKIEVEEINPCRKKLNVEIPVEEVSKQYASVLEEYTRNARIKGFRPGKAPENVVKMRYAKDIQQDVKDRLIPNGYREALAQESLTPVAVLDVSDGVVSTRALAIQTDKLKIGARGRLDFATEKIDLRFKIAKRRKSGVSAVSLLSPLVSISGTLLQPGVNFVTGPGLAALATDGWTILLDAFADLTKAGDNICEQSLRQAHK